MGLKWPTSEYSRIAKGLGDINPRYKFENILVLDLDMPERTTEDATGQPSERVQNAINMILNAPEDDPSAMELSALVNFEDPMLAAPEKKKSGRPKSAKRPKTGKKKKPLEKIGDEGNKARPDQYAGAGGDVIPKARGLS